MGRARSLKNACAPGAAAVAVIFLAMWMAAAGIADSVPMASAHAMESGSADVGDSLSLNKERLLLYERSFRPSTYDAPVRLPASSSQDTVASFDARDTYAAPETVQGFRVQVLNTTNYDESSAMRNQLLSAFEAWWVYVIYEAPTYKVRIGDFATRLEAKNALEQILAKGFSNAWLVPDKVVLHLPPRMPLASPIDSSVVK